MRGLPAVFRYLNSMLMGAFPFPVLPTVVSGRSMPGVDRNDRSGPAVPSRGPVAILRAGASRGVGMPSAGDLPWG
jgi:hypothetical protein